jgi:segregation and condensation protein B
VTPETEGFGMSASEESTAAEAPPPLPRLVEALLFVAGAPLTAVRAAEALRGLTPEQLQHLIDGLNRDYRRQGRPYRIQPRDGGHEMVLLPRYRSVIDRLHGPTRTARLSPPTLDVLSLIAYRQPLTRQEIESLRGADCGAVLRQLVRLGLTAVRRGGETGRDAVYVTTARFLTLFGLRSLEDLPRTQDLQRI